MEEGKQKGLQTITDLVSVGTTEGKEVGVQVSQRLDDHLGILFLSLHRGAEVQCFTRDTWSYTVLESWSHGVMESWSYTVLYFRFIVFFLFLTFTLSCTLCYQEVWYFTFRIYSRIKVRVITFFLP